jgi:hypothetical protein
VDSRSVFHKFMAGFCFLVFVGWFVSLVFMSGSLVMTARRLGTPGPIGVALAFMAVELGGALVGRWRIQKADDLLRSRWTVATVVAALWAGLANVFAGLVFS